MSLGLIGVLLVAVGASYQSVRFLQDTARALSQRRSSAKRRSDHLDVDRKLRTAQRDLLVWVLLSAGSWFGVLAAL